MGCVVVFIWVSSGRKKIGESSSAVCEQFPHFGIFFFPRGVKWDKISRSIYPKFIVFFLVYSEPEEKAQGVIFSWSNWNNTPKLIFFPQNVSFAVVWDGAFVAPDWNYWSHLPNSHAQLTLAPCEAPLKYVVRRRYQHRKLPVQVENII